jgi:hypothetical protein
MPAGSVDFDAFGDSDFAGAMPDGFATEAYPGDMEGYPTGTYGSFPDSVPSAGFAMPTGGSRSSSNHTSTYGKAPEPFIDAATSGRGVSIVAVLVAVVAGLAMI